MDHSTAERFIILVHHPEKSRYIVTEQTRNVGLVGALLLDLSFENKIKVEDGKLMVTSTNTRLSGAHRLLLQKVQNSSRKKKIKSWIATFAQSSGKFRREILLDLGRERVLSVEPKKFLFIKYLRTRLIKTSYREQMIKEIREAIFNDKKLEPEKSLILGLVEACKLYKIICRDKEEKKICKAKLKEIIQSDMISRDVDKVIKEMQAAVMVAVIGATAATTAATAAGR